MARELNLTTQKQDFYKQCYDKENQIRARWQRQNGQSLASVSKAKPKASKPKVEICFKLPSISSAASGGQQIGPNVGRGIKAWAGPISNPGQSGNDSSTTDAMTYTAMRPLSSTTQSLLYSGTSKEEKGRYSYMKKRNKLNPEDKYSYPLLTSWDYGWQMDDRTCDLRSRYPRCRIVSDTFFRKSGIPPEPSIRDMAL